MKHIIYLFFIALAISCNSTKESKTTESQKDSISSNTLIGKLDKDSIKLLLQTEGKVDTMTVRRKVFLDYKRFSKYKEDLYKIKNHPLDTSWSKEIYGPKRYLDSTLKVNPYDNLKKAYVSISKLDGSYILHSPGAESLLLRLEFIGDTVMSGLGFMGWYVNYYKSFDFKNNKYTISYRSEYSDWVTLEIKIIDELNDIQIWKTTLIDKDNDKRVSYDLKAPIDYALKLPILVIYNSIGIDTDFDGFDHLDLEKMFNE